MQLFQEHQAQKYQVWKIQVKTLHTVLHSIVLNILSSNQKIIITSNSYNRGKNLKGTKLNMCGIKTTNMGVKLLMKVLYIDCPPTLVSHAVVVKTLPSDKQKYEELYPSDMKR